MDDLSIGTYCVELMTSWEEKDEANFDLYSDEMDELYEACSTPVDDDEAEMYWDSDENDSTDSDDVFSEEPTRVDQSGGQLQYHIELVRERRTAKLKVKGTDTKCESPPSCQVVQALHDIIEGGYFIIICDGTKCVL